jgi:exopolysaccharide biosynthesis WecB/TagA/CpsF family protein
MPITINLDDLCVDELVAVAETFGSEKFGYVVTPNVDHIIRLNDDADFRSFYADSSFTLLDSRFLAYLLRITGGPNVPVCTGSDLTAALFTRVMQPDDVVVLIGCSERQATQLRERYGLRQMRHYNPPMGFIKDPEAVANCLQYVESNSPYRFCLIAVGTPQGEMVAYHLKKRGLAKGMTFCIGASINFLTGVERRAPIWMRSMGLEWLFRLARNPRRLAYRYLVRGPRVFSMLMKLRIVLRRGGSIVGYSSPLAKAAPEVSSAASVSSD